MDVIVTESRSPCFSRYIPLYARLQRRAKEKLITRRNSKLRRTQLRLRRSAEEAKRNLEKMRTTQLAALDAVERSRRALALTVTFEF